eukprot:jgi/Mesvir1/10804/Mv21200-RA.1
MHPHPILTDIKTDGGSSDVTPASSPKYDMTKLTTNLENAHDMGIYNAEVQAQGEGNGRGVGVWRRAGEGGREREEGSRGPRCGAHNGGGGIKFSSNSNLTMDTLPSLLVFFAASYLLLRAKPACMFEPDGRPMKFGVGARQTLTPFWLVALVLGLYVPSALLPARGGYRGYGW